MRCPFVLSNVVIGRKPTTPANGVEGDLPLQTKCGLCYDKRPVWVVTGAVTIPNKLPCVLRRGFIRKNFRINPLQRGLVGKFCLL